MASALERLRKARQGSSPSPASANISTRTTGGGTSGGSALARLRAARAGSVDSGKLQVESGGAGNTGASGGSALARLRAARAAQAQTQTQLTPAARLYASEEEKNKQEERDNGGWLGGVGYVAEKAGLGFLQTFEGAVDWTTALVADLFGADDTAEWIMENDWVNYSHADEWFNPSEAWRVAGDVAGGIGTSLAGVGVGLAVSAIPGGAAVAPGLALGVMGLGAAGTSTKEAYMESGKLGLEEFAYGGAMGLVEAGTEWLSGGLGAGVTKAIGAFTKSAGKTATALTLKSFAKDMGKEFLSEAFEEGFSTWISPYVKRATYDPNAKNATAEEILYAGFVGGLSGLAMGGGRVGVTQIMNRADGSTAVREGRVSSIMDTAKAFSDYEGAHPTKLASMEAVRDLYTRLEAQGVREATELTGEQRRALGELQTLTTSAVFESPMQKSALSAIAGAEAIAEKLNADGNIKMVDGKMQSVTPESIAELQKKGTEVRDITAEDIRAGVDAKNGKSVAKAMQKNDLLRYIVASDVAGRFMMTANEVETAARAGTKIKSQADLNAFIENASEEQKSALGAELGIADSEWATLKLKRFNEAAAAYRESGKLEQRRAEMKAAEQNKNAYAGEAVGGTVDSGKLTVESSADVAKTLKTAENAELTSINGENMSVSDGKSVRFSIDNGKVVVDTDQNIFEGADRKDYGKIARNYMREHFRGKTVEDAEFTKVSEREYTSSRATQSLYKKNDGVYDTKMKASTELDNMLRVARKIGHEDAKHAHDFNQKGYDRYEVEFSLNGNEFSGELLVAIDENDRHTFYDIVKIKRSDSPVSAGLAERGTNASSSGTDSATNSITENAGKVNTSDENSSEKSSKEKISELKERIEVKKIDAYCRENIEEYASMSAANQSMIRQVVREGRVYGLDDADILSYARVATRTGLNIVYDENLDAKGNAGAYDPENNRIVVNPKAEKRQELILIHELDHAVRAYLGVDGKIHYLAYKGAEQRLSKETRDMLDSYADQEVDVSPEELRADEASAYYTEAILGPKVTVDMLLGKEPTLAKKILNFFTGAARAYSKDAKLSKEARRHYKNFKKMFDDFAEWNQGRNAETAVEAVDNGDATRYNKDDLYITTDDFIKDVSIRDRSSFSRSLANKTTGMKEGETRRLRITAPQYTYLFKATGYMVGEMLDLVSNNDDRAIKAFWKEAKNELYKDTEATDIWTDSVPSGRGGSVDNLQNAGDRRGTAGDDKLASRAPSSDGAGSDERVWKDNRSPEEREAELIRKAQEALGIEEKSKRYSKDIEPTLAADSTGKPVGDLFDKHGRKIEAVRSVAESRFRKEILDRFEYSNPGNVVTRDLIDYHLGKNAIAMLEAEPIEVESADGITEGTLKENASSAKLGGAAMNRDIGSVSVVPSRIKGYASRQLSARDAILFSSLKSIIENGRVVGFSHPDGVLFEEIRIAAPVKLGDELTYAEITVRRNDAGGTSYVYDVTASENIKKTLKEASAPAKSKRLSDKLGTAKPVGVLENSEAKEETSVLPAENEATNEQMLSPELYSVLRNSGGRLRITEAVYKRLVGGSDKATARKIKGRWGYSRGSKYKAVETLSVKDFVKEIAKFREIKALTEMNDAEALIEIDRLWRINKDGGKAYRLEKENELLKAWNKELHDKSRKNLESQVDYLARKLQEMKDATFFNASQYRTGELKSSILKLAGIKWRGKDSANHVRTLAKRFSEWYDPKQNEMLGYISDDNPGLYDADIKETIDELAKGDSEYLTNEELEDLIRVLEFAKTFAERFSKVYYDGKWIDSLPEAQRHVNAAKNSQSLNGRWATFKHAVFNFLKALGDPLSVVKMADRYNPDGFFTTFYERIERAEMKARVTEMETLGDFDKFFNKKENKGYAKKIMQEECEYLGHKLRKTQLVDLYMSLKSQTALPGLAFSGFEFTNRQGYEERVKGFVGSDAWSELWSTSESERADAWKKLNKLAAEQRSIIEKQLTAQDMEYISILEAGYLKTKALKDTTDNIKFGYKRTKSGYYLPTVRANVAKSVQSLYTQVDLVNNISANKHTKEGTVSEIYIGDSTAKFKGHVNAISNYSNLSVEIDNYNKVFNLDVGDNPNKPTSVKTETVNAWRALGIVGKNGAKMTKEHGGSAYMMSIIDSITGTPQVKGAFNSFIGKVRGRYAQAVLGLNWKSWLSQMQSWIAASSEYSIGDMLKGVGLLRKGTFGDMDKYCSLAKLRNYDSSAAKAQGVLDEVKGIGAVTMKPTSLVDRFVCALDFCAAQVEVERTTGAKIGSEENLKAAGERLAEVILRTQQNTLASSKNAAARSGSEFAKSIVMFQSDAIKTTGRGIDSLGEYFTLLGERRAMKKSGATAEGLADIDKRISEAGKRAFKANFALVMGAFFAVGIGRLASLVFYGRDEEEEEQPLLSLTLEFIGNMLGGLPLIDDAWNRLVDGYEVSDSGYSAINDMLDSVDKVFDLAAKSAEGKMTSQESASALRDAVFAFSTLFGIPTKNIYKTGRGLIRIASPNTLYKLEGVTDIKNFASDFEEAINAGDEEKAAMILEMLLSERLYEVKGNSEEVIGAGYVSEAHRGEILRMKTAGYNILPRTIGSTVTIAGEDIETSVEEQAALRARYSEATGSIDTLIASEAYQALSDEEKEKAVRFVYDVYYDTGISELYGYERNLKRRLFSKVISPEKLALASVMTAGLESDYEDSRGQAVSLERWATIKGTAARVNYSAVQGSKRKKVIAAINKLPLTTAEKLLIIAYKGYTIKDGDVRGVSAARAKQLLSRYARGQGLSADEAKALLEYL